jgi:hypothetical protein
VSLYSLCYLKSPTGEKRIENGTSQDENNLIKLSAREKPT